MKSIGEILKGPEVSNYMGSDKTRALVEEEIVRRWGQSELKNYDPLRSALTFRNWIQLGMVPKKGEKAIRSFVVLETKDKKDPKKITKRIKSIYLFYYRQVQEFKKLCGNPFTLEVSFQEDTETLKNLNIPGLVGVLCTLKLNGRLIAFGRSVSVFSKLNKYLDRTISSSINGSFLSATNNAVKILESIRANGSEEMEGFEEPEMTEKQRQYLDRLVLELDDPEDRER